MTNTRTLTAVKRLAESENLDLHVSETSHGNPIYRLDDKGDGEGLWISTICQCVRMDDGRWIAAEYSEQHQQWQSSDMPRTFLKTNQEFGYAFAGSLEGLAGCGVKTYRSATECLRAELTAVYS